MAPSIQNFHLIRQIGEGGFGEVWLAETITGKPRAVKWVRRERFQRPGLSPAGVDALFRMEFEGVQHFEDLAAKTPELISILHVGKTEDGNAYYYIMPLADHALPASDDEELAEKYQPLTLQRWLELNGPMDWKEAISLLATISRGAAALHRAGLQHGDISSSNVLWVDGHPVLGDPGLTSLDGNSTGGGSPGFADPAGQSGKTSDVFSLGRLFYHALAGRHPAESFPSLPAERMATIPAAQLADLLDRCCDPEPAARFQDADELLAFLEPITGQAPSQRRRGRLLLLSGLAVGLVCLLGFAGWRLVPAKPSEYLAVIDGKKLSLISKANNRPLWQRELDHPLNHVELADLDGDQQPEVICSMREAGWNQAGRLTALNFDGSIRWQFAAAPELQGFAGPGQAPMRIAGFRTADLDGIPGSEVVVVARNPDNTYISSLQILGNDGNLRACYWHPGRIEPNELVFVSETPDELPLIAFYGASDLNTPSPHTGNLPMEEQRLVLGLVNPRMRGQEHFPMHGPEQGSATQLLRWHRVITPHGGRGRFLYTADEDGDGKKDLVLQIDPPHHAYGSKEWPPFVKFNLDGTRFDAHAKAKEKAPTKTMPEVLPGLQEVDFDILKGKELLTLSTRDYSPTKNGSHGWYYGFAPTEEDYDPGKFQRFEHFDDQSKVGSDVWNRHDDSHLTLGKSMMHPGEDHCVVRRWIAPRTGRVAVVTNARRSHAFNWGITSLEVYHGDRRLAGAILGKTRFQAAFMVKQGDPVDFVVHAEGRTWADTTFILIGIWKYD